MFTLNLRRISLVAGFAAALALSMAAGSKAGTSQATALSDEQTTAVDQISAYFNNLDAISGEFTQTNPQGVVAQGVFHIAKPGRLRFEYAPPTPLVIISDGTWLVVKNKDKDRSEQYPLASTPLAMMLSEKVDLLKQSEIISVEKGETTTTVVLKDPDRIIDGSLELVFNTEKGELQEWAVIDGDGQRTTVALEKIVADAEIDPELFKVELKSRGARTDK